MPNSDTRVLITGQVDLTDVPNGHQTFGGINWNYFNHELRKNIDPRISQVKQGGMCYRIKGPMILFVS